jgi:hypothetical protein
MIVLVIVTGVYAWRTHIISKATKKQADETMEQAKATKEQAEASVKMAQEMEKQRYESVLPIIDIQPQASAQRRMGEAMARIEELENQGFSCILHNIGLGPAVDLYSFIQVLRDVYNQERHNYGTLAIDGRTNPLSLSIKPENTQRYLVAHYKDVYGRNIESRRELIGEIGNWRLGQLRFKVLPTGAN